MQETANEWSPVEPTTTLGPDPEEPSKQVALPDGALDASCYVDGPQTSAQTALLHSWCVEWAEAGHGFCYVHPRGPEPRELMGRLPEGRLDDVVWIDVRRSALADRLDVPPLQRVAIDPFSIPDPPESELAVDPVTARRDAYMDAYEESPHHNRNVERILNTILPVLLADDERTVHDFTEPLYHATKGAPEALLELEAFADDEMIEREIRAAVDRDPDDFRTANQALTAPRDPYPSNPLMDDTTYDIASALEADHIVLVTGDLPHPTRGGVNELALFSTQLLVGSLLCRLWEAAQATSATRTYPLVVDGLGELAVGEATLFRSILAHSADMPLAPVLSGPSSDEFAHSLQLALSEHVVTEVTVVDQGDAGGSAMGKTGSLQAAEWYLDRETNSEVAPEGRCWLRTGTDGWLAGAEDLERELHTALLPEPPWSRHPKTPLAKAITRSVERHGAEPQWMSEEMLAETRAEYEDEN